MSIRVVELFAGVGGFRIGLEGLPKRKDSPYEVVWSNQWEPSTKTRQHASMVYETRWPNAHHSAQNIEEVVENDFKRIPDHDLLVGGFPCQDYSVANTLQNSKGLKGKKGVLWWSIEAILRRKGSKRPKYLMLENVDRLLKSPASQRGRDFAIMLKSLNDLGYAVEWRVINAADYGMPQRRRRVFIIGYHKSTELYKRLKRTKRKENWILNKGLVPTAFPVKEIAKDAQSGLLNDDLETISNEFNKGSKLSAFMNSGCMQNGQYWTLKTEAAYAGDHLVLGDVLEELKKVPEKYFISEEDLNKKNGWEYLKGAKRIERTNSQGGKYHYAEGRMIFPDALDTASRTIITGEGGSSPSRFKHVVCQEGQHRRLLPIELERLNMFPDDHTKLDGVTDQKRAFFMGNALVVGIVERLGKVLAEADVKVPKTGGKEVQAIQT